jgi:hypothetical protein
MTRHHHKPDKAGIAKRDTRRRALLVKIAQSAGLTEDDPRADALSWALLGLDNAKAMLLRGTPVDLAPWHSVIDKLTELCPGQTRLAVHFIDEKPPDLSKLTNAEFETVERLMAIARGEEPPSPVPEHERVPGRAESEGRRLGLWIDRRDWSKPLREDDVAYLQAAFQSVAGPHFIPRDLWRAILRGELQDEIEAAKSAPSVPTPAPAAPAPSANVTPLRKTEPKPARSDHDFAPARNPDGTLRTSEYSGDLASVVSQLNSGSGNGPPTGWDQLG